MTSDHPRVDIDLIIAELDTLAAKSDVPSPAVTRVLYSDADLAARAYVKSLCLDAGLSVREDPIGNTFARWEGLRPELAPVGTGSTVATETICFKAVGVRTPSSVDRGLTPCRTPITRPR